MKKFIAKLFKKKYQGNNKCGSYTIGTSGNYDTIKSFFDDISRSGLNGNITGTIINTVCKEK